MICNLHVSGEWANFTSVIVTVLLFGVIISQRQNNTEIDGIILSDILFFVGNLDEFSFPLNSEEKCRRGFQNKICFQRMLSVYVKLEKRMVKVHIRKIQRTDFLGSHRTIYNGNCSGLIVTVLKLLTGLHFDLISVIRNPFFSPLSRILLEFFPAEFERFGFHWI